MPASATSTLFCLVLSSFYKVILCILCFYSKLEKVGNVFDLITN